MLICPVLTGRMITLMCNINVKITNISCGHTSSHKFSSHPCMWKV